MSAWGRQRRWVSPRLMLLGVVGLLAGCTINHYHFDNVTDPTTAAAAFILPPRPMARLDLPHVDEPNHASEKPGFASGIVQASYQEPAIDDKKGAALGFEQLPVPGEMGTGEGKPAAGTAGKGTTFDQAVYATLSSDPKIRAGFEAIAQARGDLWQSSLFPNPTLITDAVFLPLRRFTPDNPGGPPQTDVQVGYPIDWFLFGKRAAAMASASLAVHQSEADYADLIRTRVTATATAFYDVVEAKALVSLATEDVRNLTKLAAATKDAVDAGGRASVDLNRVRLDLLKSEQTEREAESAYIVAKGKLFALLGRNDSDPTFDVEANLDAPLPHLDMTLDEAYALAQRNRPDIKSLRWQVSKAEADVVVENRKAYPQIMPQFGYSHQFQQSIGAADADSLSVSVTTVLPIFDRNQGNRAKARAVVAQNSFNLQSGVTDLRSEVQQTLQDLRTSYKTANAVAQSQLKLAADVRDSITEAYKIGGRPLIEVLDAQRNYRDTYRAYVTSRTGYWRAVYTFSSAIGKQVVQP